MARLWLIFILFSVVLSVVRSIRRAGVRGGSSDAGTAAGATKGRSPHEVLGVPQRASEEEITSAYRRLVQQYHPDRVADMAPEFREVAERRMKEINAAYEELERRGWK